MAISHHSSEILWPIPIADGEVEPASGAADAAAPFSEVEQQLVPFGITVAQPPPQRADALVPATAPTLAPPAAPTLVPAAAPILAPSTARTLVPAAATALVPATAPALVPAATPALVPAPGR